jgi:peptide/nickel transport system permease protein
LLRLILERLVQMVIVVFVVTLAAFTLVNLLSGDIAVYLLGDHATPEAVAALHAQLHLDDPIIIRYFDWLGDVLQGNLGTSVVSHYPVVKSLTNAIPPTFELMIGAQIVGITLAVVTTAAAIKWRWTDRLVTGVALLVNSIPTFVVALILIIIFSTTLHLLPSIGWVAPTSAGGWGKNIVAMIMPSVALGLGIFPEYMRILRSDIREQLDREEYVTLAWMKGLRPTRIFGKHVAPNSVGGFISMIATTTALLISGVVIVEQVFAIPGIGKMMLAAIDSHDTPVLLGGLLTIVTFVVIINLVGELIYMRIDPRVRATRVTA